MARPKKQGLRYYSLDTDIFSNRKIRRLIKSYKCSGYMVYSFILTEIYRDKGYYMEWNKDALFDVSDLLNLQEEEVACIVNYCCEIGLFNKKMMNDKHVLTSKNIQINWLEIVTKAKRTDKKIKSDLELTLKETSLTPEETKKTLEETTPSREESTQSKVNKSKRNNDDDDKSTTTDVLNHNIELAKKCANDRAWIEMVQMQTKHPKQSNEVFKKTIMKFCKHLSTEEKKHPEVKDFKKHFKSWLMIQVQKGDVITDTKIKKMRYA